MLYCKENLSKRRRAMYDAFTFPEQDPRLTTEPYCLTPNLSPEEPLLYLEEVRVDRGDCCCTTTTAPISPR